MGLFNDTHCDDEDELYPIKRRRYAYEYDRSGRNAYRHRFLNSRYVYDLLLLAQSNITTTPYLSQKTREVIYKNISSGTGVRTLRHLMDYLSRDLPYQKDANQDSVVLYDSHHGPINSSNRTDIIQEFSKDFSAQKFHDDQAYLVSLINEKRKNKTRVEDIEFDIWRIGTSVKFRENWSQNAIITEIHDNDFVRVEYNTKDGVLSDYLKRDNIVPTTTPENISIFDHTKAQKPENMLIAADDARYSIHKKAIQKFERSLPHDFRHLMFSVGGHDYDIQAGHKAFRDFLDSSLKDRGFDYIYCFHNDTRNPHYHVICQSNSSRYKNKKFPISREDNYVIRKEFNEHLYRYGIDRSVTSRRDRIIEQKQDRSLFEKLNDPERKTSFDRSDVFRFHADIFENYWSKLSWLDSNEETREKIDAFYIAYFQKIKSSKKSALPDIAQTMLDDSRGIDFEFFDVVHEQIHRKNSQSKITIEKNKKRVLQNLKKAQEDIKKHPHDLSYSQITTKSCVNQLIEMCETKDKKKQTAKTRDRENTSDKGMGLF